MDFSTIENGELEATREEDQEWLNLREESLLFDEALVSRKFHDLDEEGKVDETKKIEDHSSQAKEPKQSENKVS
jgi:hypothetical protein